MGLQALWSMVASGRGWSPLWPHTVTPMLFERSSKVKTIARVCRSMKWDRLRSFQKASTAARTCHVAPRGGRGGVRGLKGGMEGGSLLVGEVCRRKVGRVQLRWSGSRR